MNAKNKVIKDDNTKYKYLLCSLKIILLNIPNNSIVADVSELDIIRMAEKYSKNSNFNKYIST